MSSLVQTCSPSLSPNTNEASATGLFSSKSLVESEDLKHINTDYLATRGITVPRSQYYSAHIANDCDTSTPKDTRGGPATTNVERSSDQPEITTGDHAVSLRENASPAETLNCGNVHTASSKSLPRADAQDSSSVQCTSLSFAVDGRVSPVGALRLDKSEGTAHRDNVKLSRPTAISRPRWQVTAVFEPTSMTNLGKGRFLAHRLEVPSEAKARFAQIRDALEADVKRLIVGIPSTNQILWSHRVCMVGNRSGTNITTEPTILITCGSQKCRRKIKESLLRIRPHYLESLGMALIVRYDKSAPVLAGLTETPSKSVQGHSKPKSRTIRIQWPPLLTSCGLKIMIDFHDAETLRRAYATLGGIVKVGGVWYGITTAHPIVNQPNDPREGEVLNSLDSTSETSESSDSSDEDDPPRSCQSPYHSSPADLLNINHDFGFTRLIGSQSGDSLAYSFNGEHQSTFGSISTNTTMSDWAILEIPEAYIRSNMYTLSPETSKDGSEQSITITSVASNTEMVSGTVHIVCEDKRSLTGYLNMDFVSLQLGSGALDVHEIRLEKALLTGRSGSWVANGNQLVGMVVAIGDGGYSCYILPMWKVFENIRAVCGQEVQLCDPPSPATAISWGERASVRQPDPSQMAKPAQAPQTEKKDFAQQQSMLLARYDDVLSRLLSNQELIVKTLSALAPSGPILERFPDPDEKSEAFTTVSGEEPLFESNFKVLNPSDSLSNSSTLVVAGKQGLRFNDINLHARTDLSTRKLSEEHFLEHIRSPAWSSQFPATLRNSFDWNSLRVQHVSSLGLDEISVWPKRTLECYDVDTEGITSTRFRTSDEGNQSLSWSALADTMNVNNGDGAVGRIIISQDPSALHLAALHLVLKEDFDMNSILHMLIDGSLSTCHMKGYLEPQTVKQKSFVFSFKYHCIAVPGSKPLPWQEYEQSSTTSEFGLPLSICTAMVCLSLSSSLKQFTRRKPHGEQASKVNIFDPLGPWKLLRIQCVPDSLSRVENYEFLKHANGPETFVLALLSEYRNALSRFKNLRDKVCSLVKSPATLVFEFKLEDMLLSEASSHAHRYLWANQVLKLMNNEIEDMVSAYTHSLTDQVWKGEHKYIWPGVAETDSKCYAWRRRMLSIRKEFDYNISQLLSIQSSNRILQGDADALINKLLTAAFLQESRKAAIASNRLTALTTVASILIPFLSGVLIMGMNQSFTSKSLFRIVWGYLFGLLIVTLVYSGVHLRYTTGDILSRIRSVCKGWVLYAVHFTGVNSFIRELTKPKGAQADTDSNTQGAIPTRERAKTSQEDKPVQKGSNMLLRDRRDLQRWYTFWASILAVALTVISGIAGVIGALEKSWSRGDHNL